MPEGSHRLTLVVASANPDKMREIAAILGPDIELLSRPTEIPDVVEDGDSLEANARLKALAVAAATGRAAVADDTGFEVDALGGEPGIHAARYAGEHATYQDNVEKVLAELERVGALAPEARRARFRTVALVRFPDGEEVVAEGTVGGVVASVPSGTERFGYDPIFVPDDGDGRTFGAMTATEKHAISHRGRAFRALSALLTTEDRRTVDRPTQRPGSSGPFAL